MESEVAIALIGAVVTVIGTIVGAVVTIWKKQDQTHSLVNGRMDELLDAQREIAKAHGIEIGKARKEHQHKIEKKKRR